MILDVPENAAKSQSVPYSTAEPDIAGVATPPNRRPKRGPTLFLTTKFWVFDLMQLRFVTKNQLGRYWDGSEPAISGSYGVCWGNR